MSNFIDSTVADIKKTVGENKVLCAFSGGIDSVVCALLANKAVGGQLVCVMVDHGFMRKNEAEQIKEFYTKNYNLNFILVNAQERFLSKVTGITEPERKRKIIGEEFIRVFEEEAKKLGKIDFLIQGTIKPDIIESGTDGKGLVKSHHNVGGLPEKIGFKLIEPLVSLYKDDVRKYGTELGLPKEIAYRQPFPGVGLAVRCIGELTKEKLDILREADAIFREEIAVSGLSNSVNQYFAVITDMRSVGVRSGERTYEYTVALRAVRTTDFVTASWAKLPYDVLEKVSERITTEVSGINRVLYDVTSKPPATIEWE